MASLDFRKYNTPNISTKCSMEETGKYNFKYALIYSTYFKDLKSKVYMAIRNVIELIFLQSCKSFTCLNIM